MKIVNNTQKYVFLQNVVCRNKKKYITFAASFVRVLTMIVSQYYLTVNKNTK